MAKGQNDQGLMSMTGFGSIQGTYGDLTWSGDVRSVNGRSLDMRLRLPDIEGLEPEIRKRLQARLARGNVTVSLRIQKDDGAQSIRINSEGLAAALAVLAKIEEEARAAKVTMSPASPTDIAAMRGVVEIGEAEADDADKVRAAILSSFDAALDVFVQDRQREGQALKSILTEQIERVDSLIGAATNAVSDRETEARAALDRNLARVLDATEIPDEARLLQEIALVAVKTDVTEELDRLKAHVDAAKDLVAQNGPVGRKLDFLMQEFNREANTLCSKSQSTGLTSVGLDLKAVIDQMREQVQNIE